MHLKGSIGAKYPILLIRVALHLQLVHTAKFAAFFSLDFSVSSLSHQFTPFFFETGSLVGFVVLASMGFACCSFSARSPLFLNYDMCTSLKIFFLHCTVEFNNNIYSTIFCGLLIQKFATQQSSSHETWIPLETSERIFCSQAESIRTTVCQQRNSRSSCRLQQIVKKPSMSPRLGFTSVKLVLLHFLYFYCPVTGSLTF